MAFNRNMTLTQADFDQIETLVKEIVREEIKHLPTKDEFYTETVRIYKKLEDIESEKEYKYVCNLFEKIGFERRGDIRWITQEGLAFDLFHSSSILGTDLLDDCLKKSRYIKSFGNIEVYTLSLYDVIISKLARGDPRDFDDIKSIVNKINIKILVKRYKETMENSAVSHYRQKLLDLLEIKFKEWSMKIDSKIISGVKKWQER